MLFYSINSSKNKILFSLEKIWYQDSFGQKQHGPVAAASPGKLLEV